MKVKKIWEILQLDVHHGSFGHSSRAQEQEVLLSELSMMHALMGNTEQTGNRG
jgi:hypothetical protein